MNSDSASQEIGRVVRMIAVALLLSVFVVPVLMWWQAGEAGAARAPVQKVAMSRFDLPAETPTAVEAVASAAAPVSATPVIDTPADASPVAVVPSVQPAASSPAPRANAAGHGPVASTPVNGVRKPITARVEAPPDPFVPAPAPMGWQTPAPAPVVAVSAPPPGAAAPPSTPKPSPTRSVSVASTSKANAPGAVRGLPRSGAEQPAPAPVAQPQAEPTPAPPPAPLVDVRLRGIIRGTPDLALILVDGQTFFLKAGDTVTSAWVVAEIKDNSVVLRSGDHVRELQIEGGSQT